MKIISSIIFVAAFLGNVQVVIAQQNKPTKEVILNNSIDSQQYIFNAQYATPMSGQQKYLTGDYVLKVSKDTIVCYLPYFGRAYTATAYNADGGLKFTTTNFDYKISNKKKNRWDIIITPKDGQDVQTLDLTIFSNGNADLRVNSNNRQSISFSGYITQNKLKQ